MFSDLAILGLVELNEVTPELLSMRKNHVEILQRINTVLAGRTDEEKQADADRINSALGNITEEEIAARNEKQEELSSIQGDATSIAQSLGLNYRVSTADLKMMYAPKIRRWRGIWPSGGVRHERHSFPCERRNQGEIRRSLAASEGEEQRFPG